MLGLLTFLDPPRPDTRATLETALKHGVQTRMVRQLPLAFLLAAQRMAFQSQHPRQLFPGHRAGHRMLPSFAAGNMQEGLDGCLETPEG